MPNPLYLLYAFLLLPGITNAQYQAPKIIHLPTPPNSWFEFSALGQWHNKILIVPTCKVAGDFHPAYFFMADSTEIEKGLADSAYTIQLNSIRLDSLAFYNRMRTLPGYDGLEAIAVNGDTAYLSAEGNRDSCYIIKALLSAAPGHMPQLNILQTISISKPAGAAGNDGYESLVYLEDSHKLLAVFERAFNGRRVAHCINADLSGDEVIELNDAVGQRLPEVCRFNHLLLGLGSSYTDNRHRNDTCSSLLVIDLQTSKLSHLLPIANKQCGIVWEGMIKFHNGVLLVNDNSNGPKKDPSMLAFLPLNDATLPKTATEAANQ